MSVLLFKATENCDGRQDEDYSQSSSELDPYGGKDGRDLYHPRQNQFPHTSERAQSSPAKKLLTSDTAVAKTDAVIVTKLMFPEPGGTQITGGFELMEEKPCEVPLFTVDAVEPTRHETVLNSRHFIAPGTNEGLNGRGNRENTPGELPAMLTTTDSTLQCSVCHVIFKRRSYLESHMTIHTGVKPHGCSFCEQKFRTLYEQKMHELHHKGELPQCRVCGGRYRVLAKHMLIHSTDNYKHVCSVCKKAFRVVGSLRKHMLVHTDERPYTCQDCGRRCKTSSHLKSHIRIVHVREKNYACSVCGKAFAQSLGLKAHMPVHTDERPHRCDTCNKAFKTKIALAVHRTVHSSEKPFVCSTCGKCFRLDGMLKRHNLIHTGEQPYECSVCKMRFNQINSMQRHMLTHTGEQPYSCSDCGKRFTQCGGLASHRLRHCPNKRNTHS